MSSFAVIAPAITCTYLPGKAAAQYRSDTAHATENGFEHGITFGRSF